MINKGGNDIMRDYIIQKLLILPAILVAITINDYARALAADKLGDKTPRFQGRLTLNPFVHIDIIGFIMILLVGFGWGKPVETNPSAFKHYYKDDLKVNLAGPLANLLVAFVLGFVLVIFQKSAGIFLNAEISLLIYSIIKAIILYTINLNCVWFILNLIPLPGFAGFNIFRDLSPSTFYKYADYAYRYQLIILFIFVATPVASFIVGVPAGAIYKLIMTLVSLF